jgi:hypothetical protein
MNAKTREAIVRHGQTLLDAFPNAVERDPVALCKKLRRIETAMAGVSVKYCNGVARAKKMDCASNLALMRVEKLLGIQNGETDRFGLFVNRDPRGCALKIDSDSQWFRDWQLQRLSDRKPCLYADMGGIASWHLT